MSTDEYLSDTSLDNGETKDSKMSYPENRKKNKKEFHKKNMIYMKPYIRELQKIREDEFLNEHFKEDAESWKEILNEARKLEENKRLKRRGQNNEQTRQQSGKLSPRRREKRLPEEDISNEENVELVPKGIKKKSGKDRGEKQHVKALPAPNNVQGRKFESKRPKSIREILKIKKKYVTHPIENDIVLRSDWDPRTRKRKPDEPAEYIYYHKVHHINYIDTGSQRMCFDEEECEQELQKLISWNEEKNESDIKYNFLIGGDGRVYEGRGWPLLSTTTLKQELTDELDESYSSVEEKSRFNIAFIGKFRENRLPPKMFWTAHEFVNYGVRLKRISRGFTYTPLKIGESRGAFSC